MIVKAPSEFKASMKQRGYPLISQDAGLDVLQAYARGEYGDEIVSFRRHWQCDGFTRGKPLNLVNDSHHIELHCESPSLISFFAIQPSRIVNLQSEAIQTLGSLFPSDHKSAFLHTRNGIFASIADVIIMLSRFCKHSINLKAEPLGMAIIL